MCKSHKMTLASLEIFPYIIYLIIHLLFFLNLLSMYLILNSIQFFVILSQSVGVYVKWAVLSEVLVFLFGGDVGQYSLSALIRNRLCAAVP